VSLLVSELQAEFVRLGLGWVVSSARTRHDAVWVSGCPFRILVIGYEALELLRDLDPASGEAEDGAWEALAASRANYALTEVQRLQLPR
jgi:hypothetical protein